METILADSKSEILAIIIDMVNKKLPEQKAHLVAEFAKQFYGTVASEDLETYNTMDLYGSLLSFWQFLFEREPNHIKTRIYNPHHEQHGWQSTHTIVEISCKDMPFLVDSTIMEITRQGFNTHFIIHMGGILVKRNHQNEVTEILPNTNRSEKMLYEAVIHVEIDRQTDPTVLKELQEGIERVLADVNAAVDDWHEMKAKMRECLTELDDCKVPLEREDVNEAKDFLRWLSMDHFTFLACRDYEVTGTGNDRKLKLIPGTGLGVLRDESKSRASRTIADMPLEARKQILSQQILIIAKTNTISTIHRPVYTDYIGVKRFDKNGNFIGERRFIGLYTSAAYNTSPKYIPFLRRKVTKVMLMSGLLPTGHAAKALLNILETLPRDDLFQSNVNELYELGLGIYHLQERRRIRLFVRKDIYGRFFSCLVYVPRDRFSTDLREAMQKILLNAFKGNDISYETQFTDSLLARIHFEVRVNSKDNTDYNIKHIERELIEVGRTWQDDLHATLIEHFGEEKGNALTYKYEKAFSASYREAFMPRNAVYDIKHIQTLTDDMPISMSFYRLPDEENGIIHFKIFHLHDNLTLSEALPIFENLGLRVLGERPHKIIFRDHQVVWINDFSVIHDQGLELDVDALRDIFQEAFAAVWFGQAESDGFNRLVLSARLTWREVTVIRAYTKYLRQIGFTFSQNYIEEALAENPILTSHLIELFKLFFTKSPNLNHKTQSQQLIEDILKGLDDVVNLDEDRIIRRFLDIIQATYRTNFFQLDKSGQMKEYISFKISSAKIPDIPVPVPMFEIFVYSPRFEGVHLRMANVARGGIRWSDRREDFRTEILGLMKAQQVKNAVIVPQGAKGGFIPKLLPTEGSREELMEEVIECYQNFIRGLLDITDNIRGGEIIKPESVVCYDDDDPYLVVAADKGTATFSDIANQIAKEYDFWLGDAFASGGCTGYDHKKMGITARGAWESVKRHFREIGRNTDKDEFTVVGIGDMSGDVFGNGTLLSKKLKLVAAFNHLHIFVDPNPDPKTSFEERKRLFALPRSSWEDYNSELISQGGGVFRRTAKYIQVTEEMRVALDIKSDYVTPNDMIRHILRARVDLLWNGGIGTYVKGSGERHIDVGDRANDGIRINGNELRCKIVGEGGNLGLTQLGRVEYSLNDGICFTDFIDNSGGVDCSDREVNIKILLNTIVENGDLTEKQRNKLLSEMTEEVAELVLQDNYHQTLALSRAALQAERNIDLYANYIDELEERGQIDRELVFLPDAKELGTRKANGKGLTRPELAVLLAYSKNILKQQLIDSDVPEDENLINMLQQAFPQPLREKFSEQMLSHSLKREIIATQIGNIMLNEMGLTFVKRMQLETGANLASIVRAYVSARRIFKYRDLYNQIISLDSVLDANFQAEMFLSYNKLIRRSTRWILRNRRNKIDISECVDYFSTGIVELKISLQQLLCGAAKESYELALERISDKKIPDSIKIDIASSAVLYSAFDIIEGANTRGFSIKEFASAYYHIGNFLHLDWLRLQINELKVSNRWEALARSDYRDDIDSLQRTLTTGVLFHQTTKQITLKQIEDWYQEHQPIVDRWQSIIEKIRSDNIDYTMLYIVIRELFDIAITSVEHFDDYIKNNSPTE